MSKNERINELLNNDNFITWVSSGKKSFTSYWENYQSELDAEGIVAFEKAITILQKLNMLSVDDEASNKSPEFIQEQYINLLEYSTGAQKVAPKVVQLKSYYKYAAAVVVIFAIAASAFFFTGTQSTFENHLAKVEFNTSDILIQSATEEYFKITDETNQKWLTENGVFVNIDGEQISFTASDKVDVDAYCSFKIVVPNGKNYQLKLIDGTEVELNSNSTFSFNNATATNERNVTLIGEAFFEVAHNENRPFKVQSSDMLVEVLGTEFNISNYQDQEFTCATLVEGSIKVSNPQNESEIIKPGYQAKLYHNQNAINVDIANVQTITAWTTGRMIFNNEKLENLLPKLNQWFNVEFKIEGAAISNFEFTGTLKRDNDLNHFLQMLEYTEGVSYTIENNQVTLTK
ncbi:MAG: DUF4974 domain-containing protein [Flavobacteriaceae bacterium]